MPDAILCSECPELFTVKRRPVVSSYLLMNTMGNENRF